MAQKYDDAQFNPWDVIVGLSPSLVRDLAGRVGANQDDLLIAFRTLPWGSRATLAAYGVIELDADTDGDPVTGHKYRVARVLPHAVELVNVAAQFLTSDHPYLTLEDGESFHDPDSAGLTASAGLPLVDVVTEALPDADTVLTGVIETIESEKDSVRIGMRVPINPALESGEDSKRFQVFTLIEPDAAPGETVGVAYRSPDTRIDQPYAIRTHPRPIHSEP